MLNGFIMSLGMFSIIPVPKSSWNDEHMPAVIPNLPLVGLLIGIIWYGLSCVLLKTSIPPSLLSVVILLTPFILSGFIHTDGYMDTADAVFSRKILDEKRKILKDPHVGAFAVIAAAGLLLFQLGAVQAILAEQKKIAVFIFIPAVARSAAAIAMLTLKPAFKTGYNASFKDAALPRDIVFSVLLSLLFFITACFFLGTAMLPLCAEAVAAVMATAYLYKQFQGLSGDLCGCIITVGEFAALLCMALIRI